jgi:hypothetical protein
MSGSTHPPDGGHLPGQSEPGRYEIRIAGHLGARWAAWFEGLTITCAADGSTVLAGEVADQAALHGLLRTIRDLAVPLISVHRVEPAPSACRTDQHTSGSTP